MYPVQVRAPLFTGTRLNNFEDSSFSDRATVKWASGAQTNISLIKFNI